MRQAFFKLALKGNGVVVIINSSKSFLLIISVLSPVSHLIQASVFSLTFLKTVREGTFVCAQFIDKNS
jgi:hypothetical protein